MFLVICCLYTIMKSKIQRKSEKFLHKYKLQTNHIQKKY